MQQQSAKKVVQNNNLQKSCTERLFAKFTPKIQERQFAREVSRMTIAKKKLAGITTCDNFDGKIVAN